MMTVSIRTLIQEYETKNRDLSRWTETVFQQLCGSSDSAWRFLNTLSYMEHIGSFKIMATQQGLSIDFQTLKHLNEETGHAVLFKRHAERLYGNSLDYSAADLLAPASAKAYFGRLEVQMVRMFGAGANYRTIYLFMSLIVEFRAVWAYEILQNCLDRSQLEVSLARLLAEEQGHLYSMARRLEADGHYTVENIHRLWQCERELYVRTLRALEASSNLTYPKVA